MKTLFTKCVVMISIIFLLGLTGCGTFFDSVKKYVATPPAEGSITTDVYKAASGGEISNTIAVKGGIETQTLSWTTGGSGENYCATLNQDGTSSVTIIKNDLSVKVVTGRYTKVVTGSLTTITITYEDGTTKTVTFEIKPDETKINGSQVVIFSHPVDVGNTTKAIASYFIKDITGASVTTVPGGEFSTGPFVNAKTTSVTVPAQKIGVYETSYELWKAVYDKASTKGYSFYYLGVPGSTGKENPDITNINKDLPVTGLSFVDAAAWCNLYSELCGYTPVYYTNEACTEKLQTVSLGATDIHKGARAAFATDAPLYVKTGANGWRLPTTAEWEWGAKGNATSSSWSKKYFFTDDYTQMNYFGFISFGGVSKIANLLPHSVFDTQKIKNQNGLYNILGNVAEFAVQLETAGANKKISKTYHAGYAFNSAENLNPSFNPMGLYECRAGDRYPNDVYVGLRLTRN